MLSDSLLRDILAELRKKAGPYTIKHIAAGKTVVVPHGEVWEVYVAVDEVGKIGYFRLNAIKGPVGTYVVLTIVNDAQMWFPQDGTLLSDIVYEWTVEGAVYTASNVSGASTRTSMRADGMIICGGEEVLLHTGLAIPDYYLRVRRRFDLE